MGRGKVLSYSDLILDLTVYIGVQLREPSHRGASQLGFSGWEGVKQLQIKIRQRERFSKINIQMKFVENTYGKMMMDK